jgi:hypothetical protein
MKSRVIFWALVFIFLASVSAFSQQPARSRDETREQLRGLLAETGPKIDVTFRQSEKQPYNFVGSMRTGLTNAESLEIVIGVSANDTIGFRIFPHYKGAYINVNKAANSAALTRQLLRLSDKNFLYWGADESFDVFAGYTVTLESGFPAAAINIVLKSVPLLDQYVGQMKSSLE